LLIATHNQGKVREYERLLGGAGIELVSLSEVGIDRVIPEEGETYEENALAKARGYAALSGMVTLADDSGIEVDALGGEPGVWSARWAGRDGDDAANNAKLVERMRGVPEGRRGARYRCVIAVADPERVLFTAEGACEGEVVLAPRGTGGFGYDPYILIPAMGRTMAELGAEEKNRISHRGRALAVCRAKLEALAVRHV
jgi:XTP/dITP diphosphohydrolase